MEASFLNPKTDEERDIKVAIDHFRDQEAMRLEQSIFKQTKRKGPPGRMTLRRPMWTSSMPSCAMQRALRTNRSIPACSSCRCSTDAS